MTEKQARNNKLIFTIVLAIIAFAVFVNSLNGEFVYDDNRQIVRNTLIQDPELFGRALLSDVWAFKSNGNLTASNYWRPTFTAFSIFCYQLFGLDPFGWHLLNILLHVFVCVLIFLLLLRWQVSEILAFSIAVIFAVHPVHTESVAWIAGSPDLLFSLFFLLSLWFTQSYTDKRNPLDMAFAGIFYILALGAKEIALVCLPVYWLIFSKGRIEKDGIRSDLFKCAPYIIIGIAYFFARYLVLGRISMPAANEIGLFDTILTVPSIVVFYVRQTVIPFWLGPNYPLRIVESVTLMNFVIPLLFTAVLIYVFRLLAKKSFIQKLGLAFFLLPLIPTLNLTAFVPEQIVHDRYLYFPLLGFLMMVLPALKEFIENFGKGNSERFLLGAVGLLCLVLSIKTFTYNRVWQDEVSLWQHAVKIDPNSAESFSNLGTALAQKGRNEDALAAFNDSLDLKPTPLTYLGRGRSFLSLKKYEEAIWDLKTITELPSAQTDAYQLYMTYETLAIAYSQQRQLAKAEEILLEARARLPIYYAALTGKLAVVLYQKGEKEKALAELEKVKDQARTELLPESKTAVYRLGMLYLELGRNEKAAEVLTEFLKLTNGMQDKFTSEHRKEALDALKKIS
jgi:protein O-mannosyl-transferase